MSDFYGEQGVSASCFLSSVLDDSLFQTLALTNAGFSRVALYDFSLVEFTLPSGISVEQVSWAQTRTLGEVITAKYALSPYAVAVGQALALALQLESALGAFVAYDSEPVGAMVTLESESLTAFVLETLSTEADAALRARLAFEAEVRDKKALVFEPTETGGLELWR